MSWERLWQLAVAFGQSGLLGFGGGPGVVPFIKEQVVDRYHWLDEAGFAETLALGNALPGPIATKLAAFIGFKVAGLLGLLVAVTAAVAPTAIAMIALVGVFQAYRHSPAVAGALNAVKPVAVALMLQVAWDLGTRSFPGVATWVVGVASTVLLFAGVNPALVVALALVAGAVFRI
ncbi:MULTISPECIES: chromate transporter [Thermaerobacter]|uniref:Chromate transport protein ChrA n=1 Tax=Thermaerobacter subterraneus DSM 13965 TaxID=867903 RepID=K6QF83_9FIRM|nr:MULTISPECIES: chromate transporter [Thermaerobacter]EKP95626.1 chromate transport protein ChrA [Thermaerobacter subterraneus DSM 13965]QIA27376.1 chromate transporter [Thermaerobacter sp. PB12/4term]